MPKSFIPTVGALAYVQNSRYHGQESRYPMQSGNYLIQRIIRSTAGDQAEISYNAAPRMAKQFNEYTLQNEDVQVPGGPTLALIDLADLRAPQCMERVSERGGWYTHTCGRPLKPGHTMCSIHVGAETRRKNAEDQRRAEQAARQQSWTAAGAQVDELNQVMKELGIWDGTKYHEPVGSYAIPGRSGGYSPSTHTVRITADALKELITKAKLWQTQVAVTAKEYREASASK